MKRKITMVSFLILILLIVPACANNEKETEDENTVVLGKYKGIEVSVAEPKTITQEDVEEEIHRL